MLGLVHAPLPAVWQRARRHAAVLPIHRPASNRRYVRVRHSRCRREHRAEHGRHDHWQVDCWPCVCLPDGAPLLQRHRGGEGSRARLQTRRVRRHRKAGAVGHRLATRAHAWRGVAGPPGDGTALARYDRRACDLAPRAHSRRDQDDASLGNGHRPADRPLGVGGAATVARAANPRPSHDVLRRRTQRLLRQQVARVRGRVDGVAHQRRLEVQRRGGQVDQHARVRSALLPPWRHRHLWPVRWRLRQRRGWDRVPRHARLHCGWVRGR